MFDIAWEFLLELALETDQCKRGVKGEFDIAISGEIQGVYYGLPPHLLFGGLE